MKSKLKVELVHEEKPTRQQDNKIRLINFAILTLNHLFYYLLRKQLSHSL